jgi:hypothetical protein
MCTNLYSAVHDSPSLIPPHQALAGTLVSSLHRLKDIDNSGSYSHGSIGSVASTNSDKTAAFSYLGICRSRSKGSFG